MESSKYVFIRWISGISSLNGGIYTYVSICIENEEGGIYCLTQIQRYLREQKSEGTNIVIRMEMDKYMKEYLNQNDKSFKNVTAFEESKDIIILEELLHDKLDKDAKEINHIYKKIKILNVKDMGKEREVLDLEKKNACLCPWDELVKVRKDTCKYDLMWLLKKYCEK